MPRPLRIDDAPPGNGRIVISHSNHEDDRALLREVRSTVGRLGFEAYVAEEDSRLDRPLYQKILENVRAADGILLLLTKHAMKSLDVREEIGYARMKKEMQGGMKIMPLVARGVRPTGLLAGAEYVEMDTRNIASAMDTVAAVILDEFFGKISDL